MDVVPSNAWGEEASAIARRFANTLNPMTNANSAEASSPATIAEQTVETSTTVISSTGNTLEQALEMLDDRLTDAICEEQCRVLVELVQNFKMNFSVKITYTKEQFIELCMNKKPKWWELSIDDWRGIMRGIQRDFQVNLDTISRIHDSTDERNWDCWKNRTEKTTEMTIDLIKDFCQNINQMTERIDMWRKLHIWYTDILIKYSDVTYPKKQLNWLHGYFKKNFMYDVYHVSFNDIVYRYLLEITPSTMDPEVCYNIMLHANLFV